MLSLFEIQCLIYRRPKKLHPPKIPLRWEIDHLYPPFWDGGIQYESAWNQLREPISYQRSFFKEKQREMWRGARLKVLKFYKIGAEWGRHGLPRAHTQSQRSHGLQEAF